MKIRGNPWAILVMFFIGLIIGAFAYQTIEGWSLLDSFYFIVVTVTTIGYGDLVPTTSIGKIFTMFYSFFGVAIALYLFSKMNSEIFKKHVGEQVSEIKKDVEKEQEIKKEVRDTIKKAIKGKRKPRKKK